MKSHLQQFLLLLLLMFSSCATNQKKQIAITFDDIPNISVYDNKKGSELFFNTITQLDIPVSIFVNEHLMGKPEPTKENLLLLQQWVAHPNVTVGNHSYAHPSYSDVGIEAFIPEISKGETYLRPWAQTHKKNVRHFRMPFNDLGKDSLQHAQLRNAMDSLGYALTPFTIESSDWMFNSLYVHYLAQGDEEKVKWVTDGYISKTLDIVRFFESLCDSLYGRKVNHIYLAHDNLINVNFLPAIVDSLRKMDYEIVHLDEILEDPIYSQEDNYFKRWGISWIYRWIEDDAKRNELMRKEPSIETFHKAFQQLQS